MTELGVESERGGRSHGSGFASTPRCLHILPLGPEAPDAALLEWLTGALAEWLPTRTVLEPVLAAAPEWCSPERSQLSSNRIVDTLIERYPAVEEGGNADWVLGVTAADLCGGGRKFVFGEAALGGEWAVVSIARFGAAGGPTLKERLFKEALHELGHLAGLDHCGEPGCVMLPSIDVAAVDAKGMAACESCRLRQRHP